MSVKRHEKVLQGVLSEVTSLGPVGATSLTGGRAVGLLSEGGHTQTHSCPSTIQEKLRGDLFSRACPNRAPQRGWSTAPVSTARRIWVGHPGEGFRETSWNFPVPKGAPGDLEKDF